MKATPHPGPFIENIENDMSIIFLQYFYNNLKWQVVIVGEKK